MILISHSVAETEAAGASMGERLRGGEVIALFGGLGAGKTAFVRGVASALGDYRITSPTYTIVNEHEGGRLPLFHFDMYRLGSEDELFDIGWEDYLNRHGVCAVEWSENVASALKGAIRVSIEPSGDDPDWRKITIGEEPQC